ncbi:MAG: protein translocase subunit SecD, partial [Burkholderiales bacterium]
MNRYPVWKYVVIVIALLLGAVYTLPNFFGEAPAVQVSSGKATIKVDTSTLQKVEDALNANSINTRGLVLDGGSVRVRLESTDEQLKAKDAIQKALIPDASDPQFVVALNLVSRSPGWLTALYASPMYLGLDLRGGVHFMLQVDMQAALNQRVEALTGELRSVMREKDSRHGGISRNGQNIEIRVRDAQQQEAAKRLITDQFPDLQTREVTDGAELRLGVNIKPKS